jgi:hypothetical protein
VNNIRNKLLNAGVKNLKEFGYPSVNVYNILTDTIYRVFFKGMLKESLGHADHVDAEINQLLKEVS